MGAHTNGLGITWSSVGGKRYQVAMATNLVDPNAFQPYTLISDTNFDGTGALQTCVVTNETESLTPRFYRIDLAP